MRIDLDGRDEVRVGTPPDTVADALANPQELLELLQGMLRPSSTAERWVMARVRAGPVSLTPAVDVTVERPGAVEVAITGTPVSGHTPAHLAITLVVHPAAPDELHSLIVSGWQITVEVAGPQVLASTICPLMTASSRTTTRRLAERLQARFGQPRPT